MMEQTKTALVSVIRMDPTITEEMRKSALAILSGSSVPSRETFVSPRVVSRREAAIMIGLGPKRVDDFTRRGILKRVKFPGASRASGILCSSIEKAIEAGVVG